MQSTNRIVAFIRKEKFVFAVLIGILAAVSLVSLFSYPATHAFEVAYFGSAVQKINQGIAADTRYVYEQVGEIASSPDLIAFTKKSDIFNIVSTLQSEGDARHLNALVATDKNGLALSRLQVISRRADYIFETTAYGERVAEGSTTVSIERGTAIPLILIAGFPVKENGSMIGAVFGGYSIDDAYANRFRRAYANGVDFAFYSKQDGIVGTTFNDPETKSLLSAYFNADSDWVRSGKSGQEVIIEGRSYFLENIVFPGIHGSQGGVLVLYPIYFTAEAIGLALLIALIFFLIIFRFHTREAGIGRRRKMEYLLLFAATAFVFGVAFWGTRAGLYSRSVIVEKPSYKIYNSTLSLRPDAAIFDRSSEQQISVAIATGGEAVNAAEIDLAYDPRALQVTDIITSDTFCSRGFVLKKNIDNAAGRVQVACGIPTPGFSGNGDFIRLNIQPLEQGETVIRFESSTQVLANDGLGTNVLRSAIGASYSIVDGKSAAGMPLFLFSPTQPNSSRWYGNSYAWFTWLAQAGSLYRYRLDKNPGPVPLLKASSTSGNAAVFPDLADGIYYFHIAAEKNGTLGQVVTHKIMIDTTPPTPPEIQISEANISEGETVRLEFRSADALSGLENNYYVKFDNRVFLPAASPLFIVFPAGSHTITVRAFDNAGNFSDNTLSVNVAAERRSFLGL